jgi:hypothetical protein
MLFNWLYYVVPYGRMRNVYRILTGRLRWKRNFGRRRLIWEDTIKINRKVIGYEIMEWISLAQDKV